MESLSFFFFLLFIKENFTGLYWNMTGSNRPSRNFIYSISSPIVIVIVFSVVLSMIDKSFLCLEVYWALFIPTVNRIVRHEGLCTHTLRQGMRISGPS